MQMTMIEALNSALSLELERDKRVVVLGQDIGANGGVFRVTEHLQQKFGEKRVFDTPLSESAIIGSSVGMAIYGLRPIAETPEEHYTIPLGKAKVVREGSDVSIFAYGAMVNVALEAAKQAQQEMGAGVEVIDLRTVWPLDEDAIATSVEKTGRAIIVHEAPRAGGIGAEITAVINERCFYSLLKPIGRVTGYDTPFPVPGQEEYYLPNPAKVMTV